MTDEEKIRIFKTVGFIAHITEGMMDIFSTMPDGLKNDEVEKFYNYSIRDFARLWGGMAEYPDDPEFEFEKLLKP